jgi:hypothetical protein
MVIHILYPFAERDGRFPNFGAAGVLSIDGSSGGNATQITDHLPCTFSNEASKFLIELICRGETMINSLTSFDIDAAKMPLGALMERQVL